MTWENRSDEQPVCSLLCSSYFKIHNLVSNSICQAVLDYIFKITSDTNISDYSLIFLVLELLNVLTVLLIFSVV